MVRFSHDEIPANSEPSSGYGFAKDVARQARNAACSLYDKYPDAATAGTIPGSPAHNWIRGFWNDMCRRAPGQRPPRPKKQFNGGQCRCVSYRLTFNLAYPNGSIFSGDVFATGEISLGGKVRTGSQTSAFQLIDYDCSGGQQIQRTRNIGSHFTVDNPSFAIVNVVRLDGQPDNCGDPPVSYPPEFRGTPPAGELIKPYVPTQPGGEGDGFNLTVGVPFVFIKPEATVNVDVGGVNLNFDLGGVTLNIDNQFGDGSPGSIGGDPPDLSGLEEAVEAAKNAAEAAKNAAEKAGKGVDDRNNNDGDDPQNDPNKQEKEPKSEDDPKEEDGLERLLAVEVELLSIPSNARTQNGGDAPNVVYAGWFSFRTKGTPHPRVPIHYGRNYFIAPTGADGYSYTVYNGFTARAIVITAKAT